MNIYAYVRRSGVVRLAEYPYQGARGSQCALQQNLLSPTASVLKFHVFQSHTEADIAVYIQNVGPLAAIVYEDKWQHYTNGIMTAAACGYTSTVNHAVQIVGVDLTVANQSYWIVSRHHYLLHHILRNPCSWSCADSEPVDRLLGHERLHSIGVREECLWAHLLLVLCVHHSVLFHWPTC